MIVKSVTENKDGSADVVFEMSSEEAQALISSAIVIGLTEGLKLAQEQRIKELKDD